MLTGGALVELGLGVQGCQAQRLPHGLAPGVNNAQFHHVHIAFASTNYPYYTWTSPIGN